VFGKKEIGVFDILQVNEKDSIYLSNKHYVNNEQQRWLHITEKKVQLNKNMCSPVHLEHSTRE
jgi:hypothetical protein